MQRCLGLLIAALLFDFLGRKFRPHTCSKASQPSSSRCLTLLRFYRFRASLRRPPGCEPQLTPICVDARVQWLDVEFREPPSVPSSVLLDDPPSPTSSLRPCSTFALQRGQDEKPVQFQSQVPGHGSMGRLCSH